MKLTSPGTSLLTVGVWTILSLPCSALDSLTWTSQTSGVRQDFWSIYFVDTLHGWAVGNYGAAVRTVDGGRTWGSCAFSSSDTLYSVVFADPARGWMAGNHGTIYTSGDSGIIMRGAFSQPATDVTAAPRAGRLLSIRQAPGGLRIGIDGTLRATGIAVRIFAVNGKLLASVDFPGNSGPVEVPLRNLPQGVGAVFVEADRDRRSVAIRNHR